VDALGKDVLHIKHQDAPGFVLTSSATGLDAVLRDAGITVSESPRGGTLVKLGVLYTAAIAVLIVSLPWLSRILAPHIPLKIEEWFIPSVLQESNYCDSNASNGILSQLAQRLDVAKDDGPSIHDIHIINQNGANAFTLQGGKILLTRGLIDRAESPDELAGVLAHELGHRYLRHSTVDGIRTVILKILGRSLGWWYLEISIPLISERMLTSFSREDELLADKEALRRLDKARISREGWLFFFRNPLHSQNDLSEIPTWSSTHPTDEERLNAIRTGMPHGATTPALSDDEWQSLKEACTGQQ
jgi:Zn-dependent protease with chaperone function